MFSNFLQGAENRRKPCPNAMYFHNFAIQIKYVFLKYMYLQRAQLILIQRIFDHTKVDSFSCSQNFINKILIANSPS